MKIAIIGAGFTGLAAAYTLVQKGYEVTLFEKDSYPGGLAVGYKEKEWEWSLEKHYHHWFTNDTAVLSLAKEIGWNVITERPKTSVFFHDNLYQLDSPSALLTFNKLSLFERIRMATVLAALRYNPFWKPLEQIRADSFLSSAMGKNAYHAIWKPQLVNKFKFFSEEVSLAWFWARIKKRTPSLAYPEKGFFSFSEALVKEIKKKGGKVFFDTEVSEIKTNSSVKVAFKKNKKQKIETENFDAVVITLPSFLFTKIAPQLPQLYKQSLLQLKSLGAINLVLRLKKEFFTDNTYWLSICEENSPIMAIVEHTHFMNKKFYNNENIIYIGNYLPRDHQYFEKTSQQLLSIYDPFLKKINKNYKELIIGVQAFKAPFAQPIIPVNYSQIIPSFQTPLKNIYLANIDQVYPWDRGTNYAVELGIKVAQLIAKNM